MCARKGEAVSVALFLRIARCPRIPRTPIVVCPLQGVKVAAMGSEGACRRIPRASMGTEPLQCGEMRALRGKGARVLVEPANVLGIKVGQDVDAAIFSRCPHVFKMQANARLMQHHDASATAQAHGLDQRHLAFTTA